jgi:hypothetical protein
MGVSVVQGDALDINEIRKGALGKIEKPGSARGAELSLDTP